MDAPEKKTGKPELSRRKFLQGMSGVLGTAALSAPLVTSAAAQAPESAAAPAQAALPTGLIRHAPGGSAITLTVNGQPHQLTIQPATTLLEALREQLGLTGAKEVCDRGSCGACTVLLDGRAVNGCMTLAIDAIGHQVTTVEGLAHDTQLDPVQQAFAAHDACQCGYCIPGFVVRARALLDETPHPTRAEIRAGLAGNICRCGAYQRIVDAVAAVGGDTGTATAVHSTPGGGA